MSIRRKMFILVSSIVIIPMIIVLILSNIILNNQIERAAQGYLQNAFIIARNLMNNRLNEMEMLSVRTTQSTEFEKALLSRDVSKLDGIISDINRVYDYIDFYMVIDSKNTMLSRKPDIKYPEFSRFHRLIDKARTAQNTIISEEVFNLEELFYPNSEEYNKFKVLINRNDQDKGYSGYLTKCLAAISVSPVYNKENNQQIGFFVLGTIANNDDYFPQTYTKSVESSFLAVSIDGLRIASNIRSPKKQDYIGSPIPIPINTLEGKSNGYYGRESYDGEVHVFLDRPISDCDGNNVAVLGVGIPENKFSIIMHTQRSIIILVSAFCLIIMVFIARYAAEKISQPIVKATELANQIAEGNKDVVIEKRFLGNKNSETTILLEAFEKMAADLKKADKERVLYLESLENEHAAQQKLSEQLYLLNESLEEKVRLRTQDLREAIAALKKSGEVKSRFLANMSHELRTPLSSMISCSDILKEEVFGPLNGKQLKYINNILNSGNHLLQLINDILDISKIESGKMTLTLGIYSISTIVSESFSIVKSLAYRKNIAVEINILPADFMIRVDANKLKQILCNLLSNAIKFTAENGKVIVDVIRDDSNIQLTVKDNGIGIKEQDQKRIFNEFEQVDGSYEREYGGTGLGLPLTKKLVEMHNGKIFLLSQIGKGTEVTVTLPINIDESNNTGFIIS